MLNNANGINILHPKCISWSYLNLGIVQRTHMNKNMKAITFVINATMPKIAAKFGANTDSSKNGIS